jgi:hypothetical protein
MEAVAVVFSMALAGGGGEGLPDPDVARGRLAGFRGELYRCLSRRADALFGVAEAVLCAGGPVRDLARLSLVPEFGRGHGALYDGLNAGRVVIGRLRRAVAGLPLPAWPDGRIRLAADVSNWLRPDAGTSPGRRFCHVKGKGADAAQVVPGWPYSFVAALGPGATSWALLLDAVRIGPDDDETTVTAAQLREVVVRLVTAGCWQDGDPDIVIALDAGYNVTRLAWLLADLPVLLVARVRGGRVFCGPAAPKAPGTRGRRSRHGTRVRCDDPAAGPDPDLACQACGWHGVLAVSAWHRMHQQLTRQYGGWQHHPGELPLVEGTLIRLAAQGPGPEPMWLWASSPDAGQAEVTTCWQAYRRRFDIEHLFRFLKSQLGWDKPLLRDPAAADRWTWLIIAVCAQLWLARPLAADIRLPWQRPRPPAAMTPARVRAGFRHARATAGTPASPAKPGAPGPGRPKGSKNKHKAAPQPVVRRTPRPG